MATPFPPLRSSRHFFGMVSTRSGKQTPKKVAKVKNKVGSPTPSHRVASPPPRGSDRFGAEESVGSDDINYEDEESTSPEALSVHSEATTSSRLRLPRHVLQQLGLDIQARGGIHLFKLESHFALQALCDQRIGLYGQRGSDLRLRIGRKVARWQKLTQTEFTQVLLDLKLEEKDIKLQSHFVTRKPAAKESEAENSEPAEAKTPSIPKHIPSSVSFPKRSSRLLEEEESTMSVGGTYSIPVGTFVVVQTVLFCRFATN